MLLIPAIDLKDGKCVRLRQGRMDDVTVFSHDPVATAGRWAAAGAKRLHLVDLDGASQGVPVHAALISRIREANPELSLQVGGGIRDEETVLAYLDAGVDYVVIGTKAVHTPHFVNDLCLEFPGHVIVGLDAKNGKVATDGWSKLSNHSAVDLAQQLESDGVEAIIYTDISRDGMMGGFNLDSTVELARSVRIPVIASGGVSSLDDVHRLCASEEDGVCGAIIGRALYEGQLDLAAAQRIVDAR
ncbi:MAG: 1-(5-phosphoribosyl)-5-[(5-phosphoribosylamino)methylideneamino]imidazole-4-carboxamide isomerase [Pseudomonadota bacterium]|nr:1-(5-phosphoribosyl)-5-[(5-phosphoribosylamino)methylideneamino]imidazole-4-carboxamide isomerase [Pseudomonadota bacterium]HJO35538.1 1-(5-phosphoribosyl)-5-[(5-phosphoribosylamino)methylideneamino]imidazole-4-carboxamide isomerase [Gammaproteobacteria bacterium]